MLRRSLHWPADTLQRLRKARFGERYDVVPSQLAVEIQSPRDVVGQRVVTVGWSGDLTTGQVTGQAIKERDVLGSFAAWLTGTCQAQAPVC